MEDPSPDPAARKERQREYSRQWRAANAERLKQQKREWYLANRDRIRADGRQREASRRYNESHREQRREYVRSYRAANSAMVKQRDRAYQRKTTHGLDAISWSALWDAQEGCCYLCGDELDPSPSKTHVEHYHGCTAHDPKKSCRYCQRGLACSRCNTMIAQAGDNPEFLRRIADRLETANRSVLARQAEAPQQLAFEI
jgi:hypothetical protein